MSTVAIVILNYNGRNYLEQFLPTLKKYSQGYSIFVADNKSTDGSLDFLSNNHSDIKQIVLPKNYGYSEGYNQALRKIKADYYVLINSDIEVTGHWIDPIIALMDRSPEIAACQPKILSFDHKDKFEYAGAAGGFMDVLGYPFCRGRLFDTTENDTGQYNDDKEIFWATGACLFVRATAYFKAGGLDPDYFAHMEEIDLCWRLKRMGYQVFYCGKSQVYHIGGGTLHKTNTFKTYLNFRNSLNTLYKNSPFNQLLWKMPLRWILDILAAFRFLTQLSFGNFWAVIRAHASFIWHLPKTEVKRQEVLKLGSRTDFKEVYKGSIVIAYFLKKVRLYSNLNA